eukprot:scaffold54454_cov45-Attheya_sp.AAC.3
MISVKPSTGTYKCDELPNCNYANSGKDTKKEKHPAIRSMQAEQMILAVKESGGHKLHDIDCKNTMHPHIIVINGPKKSFAISVDLLTISI